MSSILSAPMPLVVAAADRPGAGVPPFERMLRLFAPITIGGPALAVWELLMRRNDTPHDILPDPGAGAGPARPVVRAGRRLDIARMFAAVILLSASGTLIIPALGLLSPMVLRRRQESARRRER